MGKAAQTRCPTWRPRSQGYNEERCFAELRKSGKQRSKEFRKESVDRLVYLPRLGKAESLLGPNKSCDSSRYSTWGLCRYTSSVPVTLLGHQGFHIHGRRYASSCRQLWETSPIARDCVHDPVNGADNVISHANNSINYTSNVRNYCSCQEAQGYGITYRHTTKRELRCCRMRGGVLTVVPHAQHMGCTRRHRADDEGNMPPSREKLSKWSGAAPEAL